MIIEQSDIPVVVAEKKNQYLKPIILGTLITLATTSLPILIFLAKNDRPTGTMLSPIPEGTISDNNTPTSGVKPTYQQMINLAQNYLNKAYDLSRNPNQSDEDKKAILTSLNSSLKQATDTINTAPSNPLGYMLRAQIFTAISKINPEAASLAKQDLEIASKLNNNQNYTLPDPVNPVNLLPDEQAVLNNSLLVASPNEDASISASNTNSNANANQKSFVIPAGKKEMEIKDTLVKTASYIYLIPPENSNNLVSIKSKSTGSFVVSVDAVSQTDLTVSYYVIND